MKVFLDDLRETPEGWTRTYTPEETIGFLKTGKVTDLSLDHDLGDNDKHGTGYDVVLWMEEMVMRRGFVPPNTTVHSSNTSAKNKMLAGINAINRYYMLHCVQYK